MDGSITLDDDMTHAEDPQPRPDVESDKGPSPSETGEERLDDPAEPIEIEPHRIVEAILLSTDAPVAAAKIASILGVGTARDARNHIETLNAQYDELGLSFRVESIAGGYQILTLPAYNTWLTKLLRVRQESKLSPAAMETLSIVAYKQPCTRADVESIRGVAAGDGLNRLREMNLVKIVGRAEDLGRPMLYGTTKRFLETFGLPSLEDLPQVEAFKTLAPTEASEPSPPAEQDDTPPPADDGEGDVAETADVPTPSDAAAPQLTVVDEDADDSTPQ